MDLITQVVGLRLGEKESCDHPHIMDMIRRFFSINTVLFNNGYGDDKLNQVYRFLSRNLAWCGSGYYSVKYIQLINCFQEGKTDFRGERNVPQKGTV